MEKIIRVLLVFSMLAAISFLLPACQVEEEASEAQVTIWGEEELEGQLPVLQVGDKWVWSYVMSGTTYTLTEEITGSEMAEGRDCYIIDMQFDPVISSVHDEVVYTVTKMTYWGDKLSGLLGVKQETTVTGNEQSFTSSEIYSYDPWMELFPLEVGKVLEAEKTTTSYMGGNLAGEPIVATEKWVIDSKEEVTVAAGTFSCWKMIMYDGEGNVTLTMWYSDDVKSGVKMLEADGNVTMELKSYSIS
jgi:hypothetical protein